jgi:hypothetical protein
MTLYNNKYVFWSLVGLSSVGLLTYITSKWCSYFNGKKNNPPSNGIEVNLVVPALQGTTVQNE